MTVEYGLDAAENAQVEIFDLTGKLVLAQQISAKQDLHIIETGSLNEGVYMIKVVVNGEATKSRQLVIVK